MEKHFEILRLKYDCGLAHRTISDATNVSIGTVTNVLKKARKADIGWPLPEHVDAQRLSEILYPPSHTIRCGIEVDYHQVRTELSKKGVTLELLWSEHCDQGYSCSYSQFCRDYKAWRERKRITMRQYHQPGNAVFVDYTGLTVEIGDSKAQIFVAALGASQYTFAKAVWSQNLDDWIECHSEMVEYFGGCPKLIVPDNLRSAVTRSCLYDPCVNKQFQRWASYYSTCIMPARKRRPQDKSVVEISVNLVQMKILAPVRHVQYDSIGQLNEHIASMLPKINQMPFQKRKDSRRQVFEAVDLPALKVLPLFRYQKVGITKAKVGFDYHVLYDRHWYSVPHQFIGKTVEIQDCAHTVKIFHNQEQIAMHLKASPGSRDNLTTEMIHMPKAHQYIGRWTPDSLLQWAEKIGSDCQIWVQTRLNHAEHFMKVSRLCVGVLSLSKKYDKSKLNTACRIANEHHINRYGAIIKILETNERRQTDTRQLTLNLPQEHENIRGPDHFK